LDVKQERRNDLNTRVEEEEVDYSWFEEDEEFDNKIKVIHEDRKLVMKKCHEIMDRIFVKYGIVFVEEDDTILSFVQ
jgi:hypothetical protein